MKFDVKGIGKAFILGTLIGAMVWAGMSAIDFMDLGLVLGEEGFTGALSKPLYTGAFFATIQAAGTVARGVMESIGFGDEKKSQQAEIQQSNDRAAAKSATIDGSDLSQQIGNDIAGDALAATSMADRIPESPDHVQSIIAQKEALATSSMREQLEERSLQEAEQSGTITR